MPRNDKNKSTTQAKPLTRSEFADLQINYARNGLGGRDWARLAATIEQGFAPALEPATERDILEWLHGFPVHRGFHRADLGAAVDRANAAGRSVSFSNMNPHSAWGFRVAAKHYRVTYHELGNVALVIAAFAYAAHHPHRSISHLVDQYEVQK